jgi:hypothetical protein
MAVKRKDRKDIEKDYYERGSTIEQIADTYGYSTAVIRGIVRGEM